ncbi:hypothetical protein N7539_009122 [Penicillium diatomitis]|uniref:Sister chromatid cohesion acetyltransferase Eco1 n=1 Tax=Penicillium diatomitis TaxID=2819901 RepID=A0A9W9WL45_9EURO|nr:uncharacterized protein N7539_009122 [Penicillium diatomitis]KAJ5469504.1 hypothetical protein N7539_009122 [Penicillium diatomitis]
MPWTVTNSFKRGLMKTYGRPTWRVYDDERYAIRESSAAVLSSPSRRNSIIGSEGTLDDIDDLTTPPSSPPPRLTPPPANTRKPTFAFLKRKLKENTGGSPLTEVNSNSVRSTADPPKQQQRQNSTHQPSLPTSQKTTPKPPALRQMQIDLGAEVRKTCATCGMEYIPSNSEDAALHKKFHEMNSTGVDLGKAFMRANASRWVYEATRFDEGYVVIVDRKATPSAKNQAKKVLEVVNKELSSPDIEDEVLWSQAEPPKHLHNESSEEKVDRYRVFLHMKDSRCVGLCLTERIWEARPVVRNDSERGTDGSSVSVKDELHPAIVGVSRIWTSGASRRKGIALDLLDCVVSNFIYGMEIPKDNIAFSQPTESGKRLAQRFFEESATWHVYNER